MYTLTLILNIKKDARNRRNACNKISHWVNRREKIDKEIADKITNKTEEEAYNFLIPYLENLYKNNEVNINNTIKFWQETINKNINNACKKLEEITNTKIYRQDFVWYITTFPRWPYNKENWYIRLYYNRSIKYYIWFFLHELLHFQFIHYFSNHPSIIVLNNDQFEFLKESLTFILNYEFKEFLWKEDMWYAIHQELRKKLALYREANKNFEELIIYWANILKKK
jgi:hypothetical protein